MRWFWVLCVLMVGVCPAWAEEPINPERYADHTLEHKNNTRSYRLYEPNVVWTIPLVIVLHGGGGSGEQAEKMSGFTDKAKTEKFAVAYPDGSGRLGQKLLTWNAGHCCGYAMQKQQDDIGFISAMIDTILAGNKYIDPARVYVTGMSNGGMMAHRVGRELPGKVAAIAPVMSGMFGDEAAPATPVSVLTINGGRDKSIPLKGGITAGRFARAWDGTPLQSVTYQADFWSAANGCTGKPDRVSSGTAWIMMDYHCPQGVDVQQIIIPDSGHSWPGGLKGSKMGDEPSQALNATDVIWDFVQDKRLVAKN